MRTFLDVVMEKAREGLWSEDGKAAREHLLSRGVTEEQMRLFGLGYLPRGLALPKGTGDQENFFYWSKKGYNLKNKLVFPMTNARGHLLAIEIKTPDRSVKDYLKFVLHRATDAYFLGFHQAIPHIMEKGSVHVPEGIFDFFPYQQVFPNSICAGTARIYDRHMEHILRFANVVVPVFDNDETGRRRTEYMQKDYENRARIIPMKYPEHDVNDFWTKQPRRFRSHFEEQSKLLMIDFLSQAQA